MLRCSTQLKILLLVAVCFTGNFIKAQTTHLLSPNQPEQDACNALVLCGNSFYTPYSYQDTGKKLDLTATPCGVGYPGEFNSVWFRVNINTGGKLVFKIIPVDSADDYDFAILNSTGIDCSDLKPENVVRCNFNVNPGRNKTENDFYKGWDGTVNGHIQTAGTYVWFCQYQLAGEPLLLEKGTVTLIR